MLAQSAIQIATPNLTHRNGSFNLLSTVVCSSTALLRCKCS